MFERSSGVLMHISSLPSEYGIGDFGKKAYEFVDFLNETGQKLWQILPLGPTGYGDSPYQSYSAFAGNFLFIDMEDFVREGYIADENLIPLKKINYDDNLDYEQVKYEKEKLLKIVFEEFMKREDSKEEYKKFINKNSYWLEDYTLYMVLKDKFNGLPWQQWSKIYKNKIRKKFEKDIIEEKMLEYYRFLQYTFYKQLKRLRECAESKG